MRSRPPSVKPAARPDPPGPSAHRPLSSDRHRCEGVTSGEAGRIGSKRLDAGAPATPRPAIAGRPGPVEGDTRLPLPLFANRKFELPGRPDGQADRTITPLVRYRRAFATSNSIGVHLMSSEHSLVLAT
jgi:hypothetical protein